MRFIISFAILSFLQTVFLIKTHHKTQIVIQTLAKIETDAKYNNVIVDPKRIRKSAAKRPRNAESFVAANAARCKKGFLNHHKEFIDLHNSVGNVHVSISKMNVKSVFIEDKYGNNFVCETNAHDEIEDHVKEHLEDDNGKFRKYLELWNFDVPRTEYHLGNGTHAYVTFVCLPGYHLKMWHDLHLRTHVHVKSNGALVFHDKMRSCECTPLSCRNSVESYFHSIGAKIANQEISLHLEESICAADKGASVYGKPAEITIDDVECLGYGMELEDDVFVNGCVVVNRPKCVPIESEKKKKKGNPTVFALVVSTLVSMNLGILIFF